jgi:hypothetical protein
MFLCLGNKMVARRFMRIPRLNSIGMRIRNVDLLTFALSSTVDALTNPTLRCGRVLGRSMSMLKGWSPGLVTPSLVPSLVVVMGIGWVAFPVVGSRVQFVLGST